MGKAQKLKMSLIKILAHILQQLSKILWIIKHAHCATLCAQKCVPKNADKNLYKSCLFILTFVFSIFSLKYLYNLYRIKN